MQSIKETHVGIVGAGPVGVVAAIACIKKGFKVTLIEAEAAIDHGPRAATTHPSTLEMLAELGLAEEFEALGLKALHFQHWDGVDMTPQVEFDHSVLRDETPFPYVIQTEQHKLAELGLRRLAKEAAAEVLMGTTVTAISQNESGVTVELATPEDGVSPGQACVIYADEDPRARVLGGGTIARVDQASAPPARAA